MSDDYSTLVYVSGQGRIKKEKSNTARQNANAINEKSLPRDGVIRILLKRLGGGKLQSVVMGMEQNEQDLKEFCSTAKRKFGVGGCVKNGCLEIQGDRREELKTMLEAQGFKVKLSGG